MTLEKAISGRSQAAKIKEARSRGCGSGSQEEGGDGEQGWTRVRQARCLGNKI